MWAEEKIFSHTIYIYKCIRISVSFNIYSRTVKFRKCCITGKRHRYSQIDVENHWLVFDSYSSIGELSSAKCIEVGCRQTTCKFTF